MYFVAWRVVSMETRMFQLDWSRWWWFCFLYSDPAEAFFIKFCTHNFITLLLQHGMARPYIKIIIRLPSWIVDACCINNKEKEVVVLWMKFYTKIMCLLTSCFFSLFPFSYFHYSFFSELPNIKLKKKCHLMFI